MSSEIEIRSDKKTYLKEIMTLAWPTMLEQFMATAVQYVDTAMVGAIGTAATAAVGSTATVGWLVGSSVSALGVGFLSYIARACGAGEKEKAAKAAAQAVLVVLFAGVLFTVLTLSLSGVVPVWMKVDDSIKKIASEYFFILYLSMLPRSAFIIFATLLRASGNTKTPMYVGIGVNAINIILNYFLIYSTRTIVVFGLSIKMIGAGLGVHGAAWASSASYLAGGVLMTIALWKSSYVSPRGRKFYPDREVLVPCLSIALPNMMQRFCTSLGYVVFASMINSLGELSTAAHTIANTVESAFYIPAYGMMQAAATLTGNSIGARDMKKMRDTSNLIVILELVMMSVSGALLFIFAPVFVRIFSSDENVIRLCSIVLRMVAVSEPLYGVSVATEGMLMGAGLTLLPFVFNVISMWGARICGTFVCVSFFGLGLESAWACMIAGNMLLLVLFRSYYSRGAWRKKLETGDRK